MRIISLLVIAVLVPAVLAQEPPALPTTPAAVDGLVFARPFTVQKPFEFPWRADAGPVSAGWILVLKVSPDLVYPHQTACPILYVGDTTAEHLNCGYGSGYLTVLVPGALDLAKTPLWFGTPGLPEQVTAATIAKEKAAAQAAGIKPFTPEQIKQATTKGGAALKSVDRTTLGRYAAKLIKQHSPDEKELIESLLLPTKLR
jgi:hypothetical protein